MISLDKAPIGVPLILCHIMDEGLSIRVQRLGLYDGAKLMRLNESVTIGPVKVNGPQGDVILSGGLAAKVVIHLDDDRRLPLLDCVHGDSGHVEGITGHGTVESVLADLGFKENDRITFLRRIPPMLYKFSIEGKKTTQMNEGLASKVIGDTENGPVQLCSAGVGEAFEVTHILAGETAKETLAALNVHIGSKLQLSNVSTGQVLSFSNFKSIVCMTYDGLRLYFQEKDAKQLLVKEAEESATPQS